MVDRQSRFRFAVYLIPPYVVARAVAEIHDMLQKQFGFVAASRFQVHATIKGFYKRAGGSLDPLLERLDAVFAAQRPFEIQFGGYRIDEVGIGLDISQLGDQLNLEMLALRESVLQAVRPDIAPDSDFAEHLTTPFRAHITLAFRDIPVALYDDILAYLKDAPLPAEPFMADTYHFLEFRSQDWTGEWHQSLSWRLIRAWQVRHVMAAT